MSFLGQLWEDIRLEAIRDDLRFLDKAAASAEESPLVKSVCKAMTLAKLHPDIEAHVVCRSVDEALKVAATLARLVRPGERVDPEKHTLEFPNGSAVKIEVRQ